jgi:hypothetical protein
MSDKSVTEREQSMIQAFAQSMRTILDPLLTRIEQLEARGTVAAPVITERVSADETYAKMMSELRGQNEEIAKLGLVEVVTGCMSDLGATTATGESVGATFDAELHHKPFSVGGKITGKVPGVLPIVKSLLHYTEPVGHDVHQAQGGLVPDGLTIQEQGPGGPRLSSTYVQWKWETFWQADIRRFVGKPLPAHIRADAARRAAAAQTGT